MNALFRIISKINAGIGIVTFLAMCAVIFYQVIVRYIFNNAQPWPEELGRYLFLICTYASICLCIEQNSHLSVDIVPLSFPRLKKPLYILSVLSSVLFYAVSVYLLWQMLQRVFRMGTFALTMPIPMWTIWAFIILFCIFSLLFSLQRIAACFSRRSED